MNPQYIAVAVSVITLIASVGGMGIGYGKLSAMAENNATVNTAQWEVLAKVGDKAEKNALDVAEIKGRLPTE